MKKIPIRQLAPASIGEQHTGMFKIREVQQILNGEDMVHAIHRHNFFFVLALKTGAGTHEIDFEKYPIHDDSIFILQPGQVHSLTLKATCKGLLMEFDTPFFQQVSAIAGTGWANSISRSYCAPEKDHFRKMYSVLTNIFTEFTAKEQFYLEAIINNLQLFFIDFVRLSRYPAKLAYGEKMYTQQRYEELVRLIDGNFSKYKNAAQYAELLNLSPYQLNAITKEAVGKTVSELINQRIVLEAKRYLLATANQVKDIADHLGYEDVSYFIRYFKKHAGHSPEAFRRNS